MTVNAVNSLNTLFENPFKDNLSLTHRVAIVAFHVFTLGIPLAIYTAIDCCFPEGILSSILPNFGGIEAALDKLKKSKNIAPYSNLEQEALDFASAKLIEHADVKSKINFRHKPKNDQILNLMEIYWEVYFKNFENKMKIQLDQSWKNEEVLKAADDCMKLAYAISVLTLEDLPAFTSAMPKEEQKFSKSLARQDAYMYRAFYYCTNMYHWIRGGIVSKVNPQTRESYLGFSNDKISKEEALPFYQSGTIQNRWNSLYNSYCDRVRMYVSEEELRNGDPRHANWTQKDLNPAKFSRTPDTQPT